MKENIAGIYNICDRWCERCIYQDRCKLFENEEKMEKELDERGITDPDERMLEQMKDSFAKTAELLNDIMKSEGFEVDEFEDEDESNEEEHDFDLAFDEDEIGLLGELKVLGDNYFASGIQVVDAILDELGDANLDFLRESAIKENSNLQKLALEVSAAIDIVKWHSTFIPSKVSRLKMELDDDEYDDVALKFEGVEYLMKDLTARLLFSSLLEMHDALITVYNYTTLATDGIIELVEETDELIELVKELCPNVEQYKRPYFD